MDEHWVGRIDEKVRRCELDMHVIREGLDNIREENQACKLELKEEIHDLAKWRERVLVYLVIGGFLVAYGAKRVLDLYLT